MHYFCLFSHLCDSILLQTDHKCIKHSPRISPHSLLCTQITIFLAVFLSSMWTQLQDWLHQVSSQCFYIGISSFLKFKSCTGLALVPAVSMMLQVDADADTFMHRLHSFLQRLALFVTKSCKFFHPDNLNSSREIYHPWVYLIRYLLLFDLLKELIHQAY